ncbi:hypothetical protein PDE_00139 [Penicillium oxalicum 114-2]|uniref:Uncharacterized protein n=1 Tax=Penicillium oxalicum (strain 114-2 / CGMCC 5302) TaxID=933388 RepID=S8ATQ1_PENO1|nr:hypothetical protein PDE_00139 [Penicillium oxalicum 114-2]
MPSRKLQSSKVSKPGSAFRRITVVMAGDIYQGNQIPQWVKKNGGQFHEKVSKAVTHLITTEQAYLDDVPEVRAAKNLEKIKIVSRDWLICSLHATPVRPVSETPFLLQNITKSVKKGSEAKTSAKRAVKWDPFNQTKTPIGSKRARSQNQANRAVFRDPSTGAAWDATLVRQGKAPRTREKIRLAIFESSTTPRSYSTWTKYSRVGISRVDELTSPKSDLATAIGRFKDFFNAHTGKTWEDRDDDSPPIPKKDDQGNVLPTHNGWYIYQSQENVFTRFLMQPGPSVGDSRQSVPNIHPALVAEGVGETTMNEETCLAPHIPLAENKLSSEVALSGGGNQPAGLKGVIEESDGIKSRWI